ncbi:hypothetical protein ABPG74_001652 [Tetrahymena malaccensis]
MIEQLETCCKIKRNNQSITLDESKQTGFDISIKSKKKFLPKEFQDGHQINMMLNIKDISQSDFRKLQSKDQKKGISYLILLDRSESMKGYQKMQNAKNSVIELIKNLNPNDRFCLIPFGGSNRVAIPFTDTNSINTQETFEIIQNIKCEGRTDIVSVIKTAIQTIKQEQKHQNTLKQEFERSTRNAQSSWSFMNSTSKRQTRNINVDDIELFPSQKNNNQENSSEQIVDRNYCFILLSDGEDNIHQSYALQRIRECIKNETLNYSINCFGFGIEHDGSLLSSIAQLTGGQYYYIKENESIYEYLQECRNFQGDILFENVEIQLDSIEHNSLNSKIITEIIDVPSNFVQIVNKRSYKTNFQHIQSNSEHKIFFTIKIKKVAQQNENSSKNNNNNSSLSSSDSLSSFNSSSDISFVSSQASQNDRIELAQIEKLVLGSIKVSFSKKDDKQNYMSFEVPLSIEVSHKNEYDIDVLKEITYRIFSNSLQDCVSKAFSGNSENAKLNLEQLKKHIDSYKNNLNIKEFEKNIQIIDFIQKSLNYKNIYNNSVYQRQLKLFTQEVVFFYKFNSQKSQKISNKINQILSKQELFFDNELTNLLSQNTLRGQIN